MPVRRDLAHIPRSMNKGATVFCLRCEKYRDRSLFYRNPTTLTGVTSWCKECTSQYYKEKRHGNRNHQAR